MSAAELFFAPSSTLTFDTVQADTARFLQCLQKSAASNVFCDLSAVVQCDSAGLAFLIEAKRQCAAREVKCIISGMPSTVRSLAAFCGVEDLLCENEQVVNDQ